jgi:hypothetical protein
MFGQGRPFTFHLSQVSLSAVGLSFLSVFAALRENLFLGAQWKSEPEGCAAVGVGFGPEVAAVAGDDRAADR